MANFDFDMFKKKAGAVADKSVLFAKKAADKAVVYAKVTKINTELISEKDKLRKAYQEIGKIYYELHKNSPETEFETAFETLEAVKNTIREKKAEIEALKAENADADVCVDVDEDIIIDVEAEAVEPENATEAEENDETQEAVETAVTEEAEVAQEKSEEATPAVEEPAEADKAEQE